MREFAKISPKFWINASSKKIRACNAQTKLIVLYLMTCPNSNMIGFYYLPLSLMAYEIGISLEEASKGIEKLIEVGFCSYDRLTDYVWIYDMALTQTGGALKVKDNKVRHVNVLFQELPETPFLQGFYDKYVNLLHLEPHKKYNLKKEPSKLLLSGSEVSKKREVRSEKKEVISKKEIPISLGGEQSKITAKKNQAEDEESIGTNNLITFPVETKTPVTFSVPLRQGSTRLITETEIEEWQTNYSSVDVRQEIRQLIAWNQANPDRQKTERGINRHIQGWLAHAQQKHDSNNAIQPPISTWDHNMAVIEQLLEEDCGS